MISPFCSMGDTAAVAGPPTSAIISLLLALHLGSAAAPVAAQPPGPVITVPTTCAPCVTRAALQYTIRGTDTPIEGRPRGVTADMRGRLIVWYSQRPLFVFDSSGRLAARVGKVGMGPGEITPVRWVIAGRDDTVHVFAGTRINVFAGGDFRHVRSTIERSPEAGSTNVIRLPGGKTARLSNIVAQSEALNPIFLRDRNGQLVRELDPTKWEYRPSRALALADPSWHAALWMAESSFLRTEGYRVLLLDTLGGVWRTVRRNPDWWESMKRIPDMRGLGSMADTLGRRAAGVQGVREDSRRRVHVLSRVTSPDWKAVRADEEYREGNLISVLEVIEPRAGRLLASVRVVGAPLGIISDNQFVTYREDRDGYPYIDVWRISLP